MIPGKQLLVKFILSVFVAVLISLNCLAQADSSLVATLRPSTSKTLTYTLSLTSSYSTYSNWSAGDHNNFSFQGNGDFFYTLRKEKFREQYSFRSSLNFIKFVDSLWIKATDYWKASVRFTDQPSKDFTHSYSLLVASQWLDSYRYVTHDSLLVKERRGNFMNPGSITLAYGLNWHFWQRSSVNFSFASVKITTKPRYISAVVKEEELARTTNSLIYSEYGMSIQTDIEKRISPNLAWENNSTFFSNGISKSRVQADFMNSFSLRFLRFMEFRIDTHIVYDPLYSYRLQFLHGFMIGFLLDVRNGKVNEKEY